MDFLTGGLIGGALGIVLPRVARRIASWVRDGGKPATELLQTLDDRAEKLLGINLPEWMHKVYDDAIMKGVCFAESTFGTDKFWENVFFILRGKPDMISSRLLTLLSTVDWNKGLEQTLPDEVKALVNEVKEKAALPQVKANLLSIPLEARPEEAQIVADIKTMAAGVGKTVELPEKEMAITNAEIQTRIAETKRKLLLHLANLEEKK